MFLHLLKKIKKRYLGNEARYIFVLVVLVCASTYGFYITESSVNPDLTWQDALWWSFVTMTTVGYGDFYPQTVAGRFLVGLPTMLIGIAALALILDRIQNNIVQKSRKLRGLVKMKESNHILILGFPGQALMEEIISEIKLESHWNGVPVCLVTDKISELPDELVASKVHFVKGNPISVEVLQKANVRNARRLIVIADERIPDSDGITLMRVLNALKCCTENRPYIVAECLDRQNESSFYQAGVSEVVSVESLSAGLLVQGLASNCINPVLRDLLSNEIGLQFYLEPVPSSMASIRLGELVSKLALSEPDLRVVGVVDKAKSLQSSSSATVSPGCLVMYVSDKRRNLWDSKAHS